VQAGTEKERHRIVAEISTVAHDVVPAVMWGQFAQPAACRSTLRGVIPSAVPVFWNIEK
jgi:peptide/nickel transport system substrate-binding protein